MHDITGFVREAVREVFSTMLNMEVVCDESVDEKAAPPINITGVSGNVSFTGKMSGVLYLSLGEKLAKVASDNILGEDPARSNDEVNDVVGELTNMVTGNLKSKMADKGYNCRLSIPTVLRGTNMSIDTSDASLSFLSRFKVEATKDEFAAHVFARLEE